MHQATTPVWLCLHALVRLCLYDTSTTPLGRQIERGYDLPESDLHKADQRHKDDDARTFWSDRLLRRNNDRCVEWRYDDRDCCRDERLESSRAG